MLSFQKVQQKFEHLKKDFAAFTHMKNTSGMGWDEATQRPTCSEEVWNTYVKANPNALKFRTKGLRNYIQLAELLEGRQATGEYALKQESDPISKTPVKTQYSQPPQPRAPLNDLIGQKIKSVGLNCFQGLKL